MRFKVGGALVLLLFCAAIAAVEGRSAAFVMKPYLQLGTDPRPGALSVVWLTTDEEARWSVEATRARAGSVSMARVRLWGRCYRQYSASLVGSGEFEYAVLRDGRVEMRARAQAPPRPGESFQAVVMGDLGPGTGAERAVASAVHRDAPGLVVIAGDIAYPRGTHGDNLRNVHAVYNTDRLMPGIGVPLMRSVLFAAAPGNHDVPVNRERSISLDRWPDALAYFYDWVQPLNGPTVPGPRLDGAAARVADFLASSDRRFPRMGTYSFDWGCAHFTVLDSTRAVDWTDPALRRWVVADLESARGAAWRFVVFHHPPFHSSRTHASDQWMRTLSDVFERGHADVVFAGHVHNYERTHPLRFRARKGGDGLLVAADGRVDGELTLDMTFDGVRKTRPDGVLYITTGAGGANLYDGEKQASPRQWQPFTACLVSQTWSFTDLRVDARRVLLRQLDIEGKELDRVVVTR